jgi:uncharacterized protein (TIGR03790 family)
MCVLALISVAPGKAQAQASNAQAAATLVVFNKLDPESRELARFYAEKRGIPEDQRIGLACSLGEEISREEYDRTIAEPLRRAFTVNFWWKLREPDSVLGPVESNKIQFIALIRGIPLKISPAVGYPGDRESGPPPVGNTNCAAVDSELAVLAGSSRVISGAIANPYYRSFSNIADLRRPDLMLVCRLDGPSAPVIRRMITDGLQAEKDGLRGLAYIDARGLTEGSLIEGDKWLHAAAGTSRKRGMPVVLDNGPELFPLGYPMRNAAIYYGWYAADVSGAPARPGFRFAPGAVAVHIHSFSGNSVRDPSKNWVGPLLYAGAAATLGNVYEPYLTLTPHLDVFDDRLRAGFTFAEAAYMSQRVLSWMTTFVGDPLYRPFGGPVTGEEKPVAGEWAAYREGAKLWFAKDRPAGEAALKASGRKLRSGVVFEGLGLLQLEAGKRPEALVSFRQARDFYTDPDDITRVAIHEIFQLRNADREAEAVTLARKMMEAFPKAPAVSLLRMFAPFPGPAGPR